MNTLQSLKTEAKEAHDKQFAGDSRFDIWKLRKVLIDLDKDQEFIDTWLEKAYEAKITEDTSDGYHTFKELYEFRKLYNAALFNEWANKGIFEVHKSRRHHNGEECFGGGWFIVMAQLPTGQISNHYELKDWDLFQCEEREKANEWDDHTAQDVANRLRDFINSTKEAK